MTIHLCVCLCLRRCISLCIYACLYIYIYICMHLVYLFIDWLHVWKYLIFVGNIEEMSREGTI